MPIIGEGDNISIEYTMPEHIKAMITDDFLVDLRNQLFRIDTFSLESFAECGIPAVTSTAGWYAAFGKACLQTHKEELFNYWRTLPWYDSDLFDGDVAEMLIERHFILGDLSKVIEEKLDIKEADLRVCNDCGQLFSKDMVVEIAETEDDILNNRYRCFHCRDEKEGTGYYNDILKELDAYEKEHPVNREDI